MTYAKDGVFHANHIRSNNNCRLLSCLKNGFDYLRLPNGLLDFSGVEEIFENAKLYTSYLSNAVNPIVFESVMMGHLFPQL